MLLIYFAVAWTLGIVAASLIHLPIELWAWWLVLPIGLLVIWRRDSILRIVHICLLILLLGAIRYTMALPPAEWKQTDLAFYNERRSMLLIGNVIDPPEQRYRTTHIRLSVMRVRADNVWHDVTGLALVQAPRETDARYGDQLQLFAEPKTPPVFEDFSYKDYLARQGIHSLVRFYGNVKILARDQGNPFFTALFNFRDQASHDHHDFSGTRRVIARRDFLDAVNPQMAILFVGAGERAQPPAETLTLLANTTLLRTDERGAIEITIDGQTLVVKSTK